jgi:hypothetical protein
MSVNHLESVKFIFLQLYSTKLEWRYKLWSLQVLVREDHCCCVLATITHPDHSLPDRFKCRNEVRPEKMAVLADEFITHIFDRSRSR